MLAIRKTTNAWRKPKQTMTDSGLSRCLDEVRAPSSGALRAEDEASLTFKELSIGKWERSRTAVRPKHQLLPLLPRVQNLCSGKKKNDDSKWQTLHGCNKP